MNLSFLANKEIVILGAGITGLSCARFLAKNDIAFTLNDSRENAIDSKTFEQQFAGNQLSLGQWDKAAINAADVVLISPGIDLYTPEIAESLKPNAEVFGDVELFCRLRKVPTIAVTGSNGKSTVVSLLAFLGNKLGYKTKLGGNIGVPVLDIIADDIDFLVLELSSFQLETMSSMEALSATVLNVCDDHLDRHQTMENYQKIKQKIYLQSQVAIVNRDDERTQLPESKASISSFSFGENQQDKNDDNSFALAELNGETYLMAGNQPLIAVNQLPISGIHNALNCLAALALGKAAGWPVNDMVKFLPEFTGLDHRCQQVPSNDGINWINDSKATNVGATLAAINGFAKNKSATQNIYLIAGGDGKGADFSELKPALTSYVDELVTLGKDGDKIADLVSSSHQVSSLKEAVSLLRAKANKDDIVLLSPACASIDMFKNYIERGNAFAQAVKEVQA